jgi:hypothetical protein
MITKGTTLKWNIDLQYGGKNEDFDFSQLDYNALMVAHAQVSLSNLFS